MAYLAFRDPRTGAVRDDIVIRESDSATIPADPGNLDWQRFEAWRDDGNTPVAPPAPAAAVPEVISDRQFAQALALAGTITQAEALAWAARGDLPAAMATALAKIPEGDGQRFGAAMLLSAATTYERHHPLTAEFGALLGYDAAALDTLWTSAAAL